MDIKGQNERETEKETDRKCEKPEIYISWNFVDGESLMQAILLGLTK